jgi:hypothetical protein
MGPRRSLAILGLLVSCANDAVPKVTSVASFEAALRLVCHPRVWCSAPSHRAEQCAEFARATLRQDLLDAGRASLDLEGAQRCVDVLSVAKPESCWGEEAQPPDPRTLTTIFDVCSRGPFRGLVPLGDTCLSDEECPSAAACMRQSSECAGRCRLLAKEGERCNLEYGLRCLPGLRCTMGTCRPEAAPGAAGSPCQDPWDCASDLRCQNQRCAPTAPEGDPCTSPFECASRVCRSNVCSPAQPTGGSCSSSHECRGVQVCVGSFSGGVCRLPVDVGAPCGRASSSPCYPSLVCDSSTERCVIPPAAGSVCIQTRCASGAFCDARNVCRAKLENGAAAVDTSQCRESYSAARGQCVSAADARNEPCP